MTYEDLLKEAELNGLIVKEKPLRAYKGRIKGNRIAIKKDLSDTEKGCVLIEELGHYYTTVGDILDQSRIENKKQERRARAWGYDRLIGINGLINAYKYGCKSKYEIAEYLNVSEEFLEDAIKYYHEKYGLYYEVDNYIVYFNPLCIIEKYKEV